MSPIQAIIIFIILPAWLAPAIVAFARHHHNRWAILALDFFLGWTMLGWVGALVWALTNPRHAAAPGLQFVDPSSPSRALPAGVPRFDPVTGRPIKGFDPDTGDPIFDD
jgi:hypothetical protein